MAGPLARFVRMLGRGSGYVPTGHADDHRFRGFHRQCAHLRPGTLPRNMACWKKPRLGIGSRGGLADAALR